MIKTKNWNFVWLLCMMLMASQVGKAFNFSDLEADNFFVTFNQPKYAPGDTAYFMGYLPANVNQTTGKKQVVHIKLLGQNNALILQERVLFVDGVGINQIIIPQALVPGVYQLNFFIETSILSKTPTVYKTSIFISDKSLSFQNMQGALLLDNSKLIIKPSSDTFKIRNKVNVVVTPGNTLKGNVSTQLSITVYNKKLFRDSIGPSSVLYMSPSYIPAMDAGKSVNSSNGADNPYYFMGRAIIKSSGAAVPDQSKITFYLNKSDLTYQITTHSGYFIFPLFRNLESEKVFYRVSYKGKILNDSQIIPNDFQVPMDVTTYEKTDTQDAYGLYAHQKSIIKKSYDYFQLTETKENFSSDEDIESDMEINLEKFEPFASMSEILSNVVPMVSYKKTKDSEAIRIFIQKTAGYGIGDPLYIINGVMTSDTKYVLNLDPRAIQKIGVLRSEKTLGRYGDLGREGILVIVTEENIQNMVDDKNALFIEGINNALTYRKITYDEASLKRRIPDLRSSLYWNPIIKLNEQISFDFYTSDDTGYYVIQIVGFQDGKPFISESQFFVSN